MWCSPWVDPRDLLQHGSNTDLDSRRFPWNVVVTRWIVNANFLNACAGHVAASLRRAISCRLWVLSGDADMQQGRVVFELPHDLLAVGTEADPYSIPGPLPNGTWTVNGLVALMIVVSFNGQIPVLSVGNATRRNVTHAIDACCGCTNCSQLWHEWHPTTSHLSRSGCQVLPQQLGTWHWHIKQEFLALKFAGMDPTPLQRRSQRIAWTNILPRNLVRPDTRPHRWHWVACAAAMYEAWSQTVSAACSGEVVAIRQIGRKLLYLGLCWIGRSSNILQQTGKSRGKILGA